MMTAHNTKVDVDHLRRTLVELGYPEPVTPDAAPLIHRILTDLQQVTHQYSDLSQHYDDLVVRYQRETSTEKTSPNLDFTHLSGLDASLLGMSNIMDDSFMLRTVEEARAKIDTLQAEVQALQAEAGKLLSEKEAVFNELQQSQLTAQELSQLLHSRNGQVDALQSELETQKKKTDVGFMLQLGAVVKTAIYMLPNELHQAFAAKFSDSPEAQTGLLTEVLQRLQRDGDGKSAKLKEVLIQLEKCQVERSELEESLCKLKAGVSQYQTQIADLNARLSRKDFETTIQTDV